MTFAHALVERGVDVFHGHSSHHPRPIAIYRGQLVLYGCGDLINDYEGIQGRESFQGGLVLAYLPWLDAATGELLEVSAVAMRVRGMRLERASGEETAWLAQTLSRIVGGYGSRADVSADGSLVVRAMPSLGRRTLG